MTQTTTKPDRRGRAVVIGGGMAGLLTAAALHEHFDDVTVVERDRLPDRPASRRGTPHDRHLHTYWMAGLNAVEQLLPGFRAALADAGAQPVRLPTDIRWLTPAGAWVHRFDEAARLLSASRSLLEWTVRRRVEPLDRLTILENHDMTGLRSDPAGHVNGLATRPRGATRDTELPADLVVDASGRGSRLPGWLRALGRTQPTETTVDAFLGYATRYYVLPADPGRDWKALYIQPAPPEHTRGGVMFPIEDGRWVVTLVGGGRDYPPTDEAGFLAFARSLRSRELSDAIAAARPVSPVWGYRRTANHRRHYERLRDMPGRLLAVGDSLCAFNPVYGQGMTVAALQAHRLDLMLRGHRGRDLVRFTRGAQRAMSTVADDAWLVSTGEDLRYPSTEGARITLATRISHRYMDRVIRAVAHDREVNAAFLRVLNLIDAPRALFRPGTMIRTLRPEHDRPPVSGAATPTQPRARHA
jgi:2-polyprenyl-6-methoxyphenol hydroxylase-like FAD-dependent oxidoreductase